MTESYEECAEDEICVELDQVSPAETATIIADERVAQAVREARHAYDSEVEDHKREHGEDAEFDISERIIKIRVHSW